MRLLHTSEQRLYEFTDDRIPPYAILSHTWGDIEVTHHDFLQGTRTEKIIRSCALAASESWNYIWIDTCCIDKSSSAELSEAINSMYRWYQMAEVCYAYLEDVSVGANLERFTASRWFTRGWTLQELVAPTRVIFLDHAWRTLGSKSSMLKEVSMATRIEPSQLAAPVKASAAAKMSWMSRRRTTRIEDMAYCLMGLFEVNMPLLYGEGERAFARLQGEIIRQTDDQSIFAWMDRGLEYSGMFARHPSAFEESGNIEVANDYLCARKNYKMTNRGLKIKFPILEGYHEYCDAGPAKGGFWRYEIPLNCRRSPDVKTLIFITLKQYVYGKCGRVNSFELKSLELPEEPLDVANKTLFVASWYVPRVPWLPVSSEANTISTWTTTKIQLTTAVKIYFPYFKDISGTIFSYMQDDQSGTILLCTKLLMRALSVGNDKLVAVHDREILSTPSTPFGDRAASFSNIDGDGFVLYWWQSPDLLTPTVVGVHLFSADQWFSEKQPHKDIFIKSQSSRHSHAIMHLESLDIWTYQPSNIKGKSLYVRLRHEIHDQRRQLVIDVDVLDTLPEPRVELE